MTPRLTPALLAALLLAAAAFGQGKGGPEPGPVQARLACGSEALRPGATNRLAVVLDLQPGWHVYAPFANDSGGPVAIELSLPAGWTGHPGEGPAPRRHVAPGDLLDHVLEGRVALPLDVDVPAEAAGTRAELRARVAWMACRDVCLLGEAAVELTLRVAAAGEAPPASRDAELLREALARVPRPLPGRDAPLTARVSGSLLQLHAPGAAGLAFYPDADAAVCEDLLRDGAAEGESLALRLRPGASDVRGVAELRWPDGRPNDLYRIRVPRPQPGPTAPQPEETPHAR